jgi:hypothetical protein
MHCKSCLHILFVLVTSALYLEHHGFDFWHKDSYHDHDVYGFPESLQEDGVIVVYSRPHMLPSQFIIHIPPQCRITRAVKKSIVK